MKKKSKWLVTALCLLVFAAMALGSGSSDSEGTKDVVKSESNANGGDDKQTNQNDSNSTGGEESKTSDAQKTETVTIEEQVILNRDGIVITAKEYVKDSIWGDGIKLLLENNTDKTVSVGCEALIVNNYMVTDLFSSEVAAGKKANETLYLSNTALEAAGIDVVGLVEIYFKVYDSESFKTIFTSDCVSIQTSAYANMDTTPDDTGVELYNQGGIRIVGKTVDEDSFWGKTILLYCENTSGKNVGITVEELSINGFMITPMFSATVYDGKMAMDDITLFSSELETNGITEIEEVELKFHIYDTDSYKTIADSDEITFSAK